MTILRPSYLLNGISYTDKMASLYWTVIMWCYLFYCTLHNINLMLFCFTSYLILPGLTGESEANGRLLVEPHSLNGDVVIRLRLCGLEGEGEPPQATSRTLHQQLDIMSARKSGGKWGFNSLAHGRCGFNLKLIIFKLIQRIVSWAFPVILPSGKFHKTSLIVSQHWFR